MTLAQELQVTWRVPTSAGRLVRLEEPPVKLPFNGTLSADEQRMLEQFAFEANP